MQTMIRALLINPFSQFNSKKVEEVQLEMSSNNTLDLKVLYKLLDCELVEFVYDFSNKRYLIVDEEGLLRTNQEFFKIKGFGQEIFAGKGLVVKFQDEVENVINLSEQEIDQLKTSISMLSREKAYELLK